MLTPAPIRSSQTPSRLWRWLAVALLLPAVGLTGCGGGSDAANSSPATNNPSSGTGTGAGSGTGTETGTGGTGTGTGGNLPDADNLSQPNFWPNATLLGQARLGDVPDPGYVTDEPAPLRPPAITGASRIAGALQSVP